MTDYEQQIYDIIYDWWDVIFDINPAPVDRNGEYIDKNATIIDLVKSIMALNECPPCDTLACADHLTDE